mgnify:FL=1|jgi:hypothetical protein
MTTLTLEIDNPSILTHLKAVLKAIHGVKILNVNNAASDENIDSEQPNDVTIAAMKEAKEGNDAGVVCMDSLERFMSSMN